MEDEKLEEQTEEVNKKLGFGQNANQTFGEYQNWLANMKQQEDQSEEQILSDQRTKAFVSRGFGNDKVLRKMIGINMLNNGIIDNNLMGYYLMKD